MTRKLLVLALFMALAGSGGVAVADHERDAFSLSAGVHVTGLFERVTNGVTVCSANTGTVAFVVDLVRHTGAITVSNDCGRFTHDSPAFGCGQFLAPLYGVWCAEYLSETETWAQTDSRVGLRRVRARVRIGPDDSWRLTDAEVPGLDTKTTPSG